MSGLIDNLIEVLEEQNVNYSNLLALSEEKRDVIVGNDIESLQRITNVENVLVSKNLKLEKKREMIYKDIANVLNYKEKALTLRSLAELVQGQPECPRLIEVTNKMRDIVEQLKARNEQNKVLIDTSLEYIDFTMNLMRGALGGESPYYSSKGESIEESKAFFDAKQ